MPNQYTKAAELGEPKPKGTNQFLKAEERGEPKPRSQNQFTTGKREMHSDATKDKMRAERAAQVLEDILGEQEASRQEKIAAAKALLPFGKASLSSVMQTNIEQPQSEDEIRAALRALISANPEVARELNIGLRPVDSAGSERSQDATNAAQHGDSSTLAA